MRQNIYKIYRQNIYKIISRKTFTKIAGKLFGKIKKKKSIQKYRKSAQKIGRAVTLMGHRTAKFLSS